MPTRGPDPVVPRQPRRRAALAAALLLVGLAGCSDDPAPAPTDRAGESSSVQVLPGKKGVKPRPRAARNVLGQVQDLLAQRSQALRSGSREDFLAGVAQRDPAFVAHQEQYFDNLAQLPVGRLSYRVDRASLLHTGRTWDAVVDLGLRLRGFDSTDALTRFRMRFQPVPGGMRLLGVEPGGQGSAGGAQPWDLGPIEVRRRPGLLGVFDAISVRDAGPLMNELARAVPDVRSRVPTSWSGQVVVYALSDLTYLQSLDHVPGGEPSRVDALTVTVPAAGPQGPVDSRIVLHPSMLARPGPARERLLRHELTHVATGPLGPGVPLWLSEGIAEYVSVQSLSPADRGLSRAAIQAAGSGLQHLPADRSFNGARSTANYGIAWWACETIARGWSESGLWSLLEALDGVRAGQRGRVLQQALGIGEPGLARQTARLIQREYGAPRPPRPAPPPKAKPSPGPSQQSASPGAP